MLCSKSCTILAALILVPRRLAVLEAQTGGRGVERHRHKEQGKRVRHGHGHRCYEQQLPLSNLTTTLLGTSYQPATRSLVYKGWLIRDAFQRLLDLLEILRDEV